MKVLLLHPEDQPSRRNALGRWDLVVDFGRAPISTYDEWSRQAGCRVISLYDFALEIEDLYYTRKLLQLGMGSLVDEWGIDWWDVLSLEVAAQLQQLMLVHRLANHLTPNSELYAPPGLLHWRQRCTNCVVGRWSPWEAVWDQPFAISGTTRKPFRGSMLLKWPRFCRTNLTRTMSFDAASLPARIVRDAP